MAVVLISLLVSLSIGISAGFAVYWLSLRRIGRRFGLCAAITTGILVLGTSFVPITSWMVEASATTIIGLDPREGARRLEFLGLPADSTSDFCYRVSPVGITILADFEMSEADFLEWMRDQHRDVVAFDLNENGSQIVIPDKTASFESMVYPVRQYESRTPLTVMRGYCHIAEKTETPDNTDRVIYDLDSGRVYVERTTY